jgi:hypothetical protein
MADAILRAKMRVVSVRLSKEADGSISSEEVNLQAVYGNEGTENAQWAKWTPAA